MCSRPATVGEDEERYVVFGEHGKIVVLLAELERVQRHEQLLVDVVQHVWRHHLVGTYRWSNNTEILISSK